jgi:hypothetical protein
MSKSQQRLGAGAGAISGGTFNFAVRDVTHSNILNLAN